MNLILNIITRIDMVRYTRPRLFRLGLICLWCIAPIEMLLFKIGIWSFTKLKAKYTEKDLEEMK